MRPYVLLLVFTLLVSVHVLGWPWVVSGHVYWTLRGPLYAKADAHRLHVVHRDLQDIVQYIREYCVSPECRRLVEVFPAVTLTAFTPEGDAAVAHNRNKAHIYLCLDTPDHRVLLYVALHELAHCGTRAYDPDDGNGRTVHSEEHTSLLAELYEAATQLGKLKVSDVRGRDLCGERI